MKPSLQSLMHDLVYDGNPLEKVMAKAMFAVRRRENVGRVNILVYNGISSRMLTILDVGTEIITFDHINE